MLDPDPSGADDILAFMHPFWTSPLTMAPCIMEHLTISHFLGMLVVMLAVAKIGGFVLQKLGQPAVLGELIGGVCGRPIVVGTCEPGI